MSALRRGAGILALAFVVNVAPLTAQLREATPPSKLALRIETGRQTYRVGDEIAVRLTLRNVSNEVQQCLPYLAMLVDLRVYDTLNHEVAKHEPYEQPPRFLSGPSHSLAPDQELVVKGWRGQYWRNVGDWGYHLRQPGRYAIEGLTPSDCSGTQGTRIPNGPRAIITITP